MAQILDLGKIRFNWAGTYNSGTEYEYNDLVKYGPNLYAYTATNAATGIVPTNTANWVTVVEGINYRGTYSPNTLYYKNDIVFDGTSTYIVIVQHTSDGGASTGSNANLTLIALGQEGLPSFTNNIYKLLTNNGSEAAWTDTASLTKTYVGTSQGSAASDFETNASLSDVAGVFAKSTTSFGQLAMVNPSNGGSASADVIVYTADGTNDSGWIDIGITSNNFSAETFGITGPHDGYIFMSAPRLQEFDVSKIRVISTTATATTTVAHGFAVGNIVKLEGIGNTISDGLVTLTAVSSTTFSWATTVTPFSEVDCSPFGSVYKPKGSGNLVFATDRTGLDNNIVFAAGGFDSGTSQMTIHPNDRVDITISTPSTSATTGALVVAGGVGIGGAMYAAGKGSIDGTLYLGADAEAFETAAGLTSAHLVLDFDSDGEPFGQVAMKNNDPAASADLQIYNNVGTDASGWLDMGITGSEFEQAEFGVTGPNEGYIFFSAPDGVGPQYAGTGNLTFATSDAGDTNAIIFAAGGFTTGRTQMAIYPDVNVHIDIDTPSTSASTGALTVIGGVGIQGDVNIAGNITFGGEGTQISTANLAVTAPLIFTGDASTSSTNDLGLVTEGKYTITTIPVATIINKEINNNVAILTTRTDHNFAVNDSVLIANVDATLNGTYTITAVTSDTFRYAKTTGNVASTAIGKVDYTITNKSLNTNVATLTTSTTHAMVIGTLVTVAGVDSTFNGTYTVTAVTSNTFSYAKTATNVTSTSSSGTATYYTSVSTATVSAATRTRWSAWTKHATDGIWNLVSNLSTKPDTTINYAQDTYGTGVDVAYDAIKIGGLINTGNSDITGNTTIGGTAGVTGNFAVNTNKFTVTASSGNTAVAGTLAVTGDSTLTGDLAVNGGDITTTATTFNLVNATATTVNIAGAGTAVGIGASTGTTTVKNDLAVTGGVAINTNKFTVASASGNTSVAGTLGVTGNTTLSGTLSVTGLASFPGGISVTGTERFTGRFDVQEMREDILAVTMASNILTCDYTQANIFYSATAPSAAWTINLTNTPTDDAKSLSVSVIQVQGGTGYVPTTFQIDGAGVTIKWAGGTVPTATSSSGKLDIFNFSLLRVNSAWQVLGSANLNY